MSVAEVLAGEDGPFATPHDYTLGPSEAFAPSTIAATFDGSGAAGAFLPCVSFFSQDGRLLGRAFPNTTVAAGSSAVVTASPFVLPATASGGGGSGSEVRRDRVTLTNPLQSADAGNAFPTVLNLASGDWGLWEFLNGVEGVVLGNVWVPHAYASGGAIILAMFCHAGAAANVRLVVSSRPIAAGGSVATVLTAEAAQVVAMATNDALVVVTFNLTPALAADSLLELAITRQGNLGTDTLAQPLFLFGAWLQTTVSG